MATPLVSLIMPSYNYEAYLHHAIRSATGQTYGNIELVVCDDCSTDNSYQIALDEAQKDPRITVFQNDRNLGISRTRQRLLESCRGRYVGHLDCDDFLERWAVEEMVAVFENDPSIALIYSDSAFVDKNGKVTNYKTEIDYSYANLVALGWRHFGMYRRDLALKYGGINTKIVSGCDDGDLFMKIASRHKCHHLAKVLYYYRCHDDNRSRTNKKCETCEEKPECNYFSIWSRIVREFYPDHPLPGEPPARK
jgi:glycosyltransferase involved in cell wall biosynthesis